jgi:hypothetical protein
LPVLRNASDENKEVMPAGSPYFFWFPTPVVKVGLAQGVRHKCGWKLTISFLPPISDRYTSIQKLEALGLTSSKSSKTEEMSYTSK